MSGFPHRLAGAWQERGLRGLLAYLFTPPRKLIPTKSGWIFFLFMLVIILFGYTTNNNLLFLLFSAMLAVMTANGILSEASLGDVSIERRFPSEIFAKRPFTVEMRFRNQARYMSAFAFSVRDPALFDSDNSPFMVSLAAGREELLRATARIKRRGRHKLPVFALSTQYPFLLFTKTRLLAGGEELIVYPGLRPVDLSLDKLFAYDEGMGPEKTGDGDAFAYIREYVEGEPIRRVDWKKSARLDSLYVKEFDQRETRSVAVRFYPDGADDFEPGLETTASVLIWLFTQGVPFNLSAGQPLDPGYGASLGRLQRGLRTLALYKAARPTPHPSGSQRVIEVNGHGDIHIH